ncbi:hypothetical protein HNR60_004219 [Rhodopseudomonas rhenobacensis]|uniref:Uncharacterized protein n=1 Tax=Rhodopseudomonas rhenobacensis TaxID=87461 RepID=A0A7W7Z7G9_9BRAD|nr:hypothetical protein [Rhodopseudomonas rhenobacensis]MBB5049441.1 hypothetical protein [Rhodopseudomonas rhenobacensis]
MDALIRHETIELYRRLLSQGPTEEQRRVLLALLRCLDAQDLVQPTRH